MLRLILISMPKAHKSAAISIAFTIAAVSTTTMASTTFVTTTVAITAAQSVEADRGWWKKNSSPVTSLDNDSPTKNRRRSSWLSSLDGLHNDEAHNSANSAPSIGSKSNSQKIREALTGEFPELETLYSDAYLETIAGVPGRSLCHATQHNIRRSLEWRRSYGVRALREAFEVVVDGKDKGRSNDGNLGNHTGEQSGTVVGGRYFVPCHDPITANSSVLDSNNHNESSVGFVPTPELVQVCSSGALMLVDEELIGKKSGRDNQPHENCRWLVVYADTSRLNWWKTGITAGLQYHVLVLEDALERIRNSNRYSTTSSHRGKEPIAKTMYLEESIILCVDTTAPPFLPPPLGVLTGMTKLLQKAYPDRIHKIFVGPVSPWLRALYKRIRPFLKPRSRDKIVLLGEVPSMEFLARWQSDER